MENKRDKIFECSNLQIGHIAPLTPAISFSLYSGQVAFIKGDNGSGKTTLIKTILGELGPLGGSYKWHIDKNFISYSPQITNPNSNFSFTIGEILGLYDLADKSKNKLPQSFKAKKWIDASRGEKQKVMLFTRLTQEARVLILDEPFNHLDRSSVQSLADLLIDLVRGEDALSIVLVGHIHIDFPSELLIKVEL